MTEERVCGGCDTPIPARRLAAMPNATMCVSCLQGAGDVPTFKGIMIANGKCDLEAQMHPRAVREAAEKVGRQEPLNGVAP